MNFAKPEPEAGSLGVWAYREACAIMALNPPLGSGERVPKSITGEIFLMSRNGMSFQASIDGCVENKALHSSYSP
jgi:hypothetical protein